MKSTSQWSLCISPSFMEKCAEAEEVLCTEYNELEPHELALADYEAKEHNLDLQWTYRNKQVVNELLAELIEVRAYAISEKRCHSQLDDYQPDVEFWLLKEGSFYHAITVPYMECGDDDDTIALILDEAMRAIKFADN